LREEAEQLEESNETLKTASLYVATAEEVLDDQLVVRQHGNNQEVLTDLPPAVGDAVEVGDRVAVDDSFAVNAVLDRETDARARAMEVDESPNVTYEDIGGIAEQLTEVRETVEMPLERPEQFETIGIDPPSGVLLYGPPGTGKTMLAKAVANETDATFIKMAGSELVHKFIGEGSKLVRDLFEVAAEHEPAVVFIDEIDAIASKRTDSKTSGDAEVQRTMMQLLSEMDGFEDRGEVRLIAATNQFDMLDRAILRPGRFDRLIEVPKPDRNGRAEIFRIHTRDMEVADDVDFDALAEESDGASGADIKAICTEAGMFAIRDDRGAVAESDFREAIDKVDEASGTPADVIRSDGYADYAY
jgi:proteasome regulatory subunit